MENTMMVVDLAWCNGFPETRVLRISNPMLMDFGILCGVVTATCCEDVWFIYPMSPTQSSLLCKEKYVDSLDDDLQALSDIQSKLKMHFDFPINFILEIASGVWYNTVPVKRKYGFKSMLD